MTKIVLIDPHAEYRAMFKSLIEHQRWSVIIHEAANCSEGLKVIKKQKPDIVFLDIGTREVNGNSMEVFIKAMQPLCRIILLTPFDSKIFIRWYKTPDIEDFVSKDTLSENFVLTMKKYLNI